MLIFQGGGPFWSHFGAGFDWVKHIRYTVSKLYHALPFSGSTILSFILLFTTFFWRNLSLVTRDVTIIYPSINICICIESYTTCINTNVWNINIFNFIISSNNTTYPIGQKQWVHVLPTLPETNIARETLGLEDEFPFGKAFCQVLC